MIENNLQFEMQSMASCPPRFLSVKRARNLSVNGLGETEEIVNKILTIQERSQKSVDM